MSPCRSVQSRRVLNFRLFECKNGDIVCYANIKVDESSFMLFKRQTAYYIPIPCLDPPRRYYLFKRDLFKRENMNVWFKSADNKSGNKICFAKNVDPDCKSETLRGLLSEMDKKLECRDSKAIDDLDGRLVYYLAVGQMKHSRIRLKLNKFSKGDQAKSDKVLAFAFHPLNQCLYGL
jgi:hypothetical protein